MLIVVVEPNLLAHRERFEAALPPGAEVIWNGSIDDLRDADVFVGGRFTAEMAAAAEKLRLVHVAGAGTDKIDFSALQPETLVANTFHHERSIAEYVLAAAVLLRRDFLAQDRALRRGIWASSVYDSDLPQLPAIGAARVGLVGFGHIGRRVWELFRSLGSTGAAVTGSGRVDAVANGLSWAGDTAALNRLMTESDVVVVSAPLTAQTEGMIGAEQLRALGADGVLINVGRGPLVAERALYDALLEGSIRAAAIDVWYRYPGPGGQGVPSELPFGELANVLMTPHSSGVTTDTFGGRAEEIAANIGRLDRGEPLTHQL
ncbi:hydroxyacid dehydrogenase [Mycolicibacterium sp. (ex Dasyatis americana)]|uniref:2-hydroxyacid dehydrogenase n=1 Tax=Mycobacterium syngnathidarum TaxID=1908205 RepID=UPI000871B7F2|nr:2-hydroxyacid dehydrogenase [Mycobacterium syngnathidarum]OFB42377.1 hydroxyacid dehydrogenase [Mycolicibacterium sp. (ex Dasyatis americana)]OLT98466.1 hydroxyacid dehydrogenase [Mycobacterium syngnathidarum]